MNRGPGTGDRGPGLLLLLLLGAMPVSAQAQLSLSGGAVASPVTRRVAFAGRVREQTGTWFGGEGSVALGKVELGVSGMFGSVAGDSDQTTNPDLKMRVSDIWLRFEATPWLALGAIAQGRRHESDVGVNAWRLIGPTVRVTPPLGLPGLSALADVAYFASASVMGSGEKISPAFRATLGASYSPPPGRMELRVAYRFERFDFAAVGASPARLEQFSGVVAGIAFRIGR